MGKLLAVIILFLSASSFAAPVIDLVDYEKITDYTGLQSVLIQKGDDQAYGNPDFDDSKWEIISFPHNWDDLYKRYTGICWYRLHVKFPDSLPVTMMGIDLGVISDADQVFFNGTRIAGSGKFPPNRVHSYDRQRIYEIPTHLIKKGKINVIAIRAIGLFPGEGGAIKGRLKLGPFNLLQRNFFKKELLDVIFAFIYITIAIYFSLVFLRRSISKEYLLFSIFTVITALYIILRSQVKYFISDNFLMLKRFEYVALVLMLPLMMEYITFFLKRKHTIFHYIYLFIALFSLAVVIGFNDLQTWNKILVYVIEPSWLIPILLCLYISFKELRNDPDAKFILISFIVVWIMFINDVLIERLVYNFYYVANYGFLIIIIGTSVIMRRRMSRLSSEIEEFRTRKGRKPDATDETKKKFQQALDYLNENYMYEIARENLAGVVGLNHDYMGKLFIQLTGMKMNDYINELRVKKASEMLLESEASVTEIAFKVGFESLATFYRVFQKHRKESPNSLRERNKK